MLAHLEVIVQPLIRVRVSTDTMGQNVKVLIALPSRQPTTSRVRGMDLVIHQIIVPASRVIMELGVKNFIASA